jgi:hypothetical protein
MKCEQGWSCRHQLMRKVSYCQLGLINREFSREDLKADGRSSSYQAILGIFLNDCVKKNFVLGLICLTKNHTKGKISPLSRFNIYKI